MKKHIIKQVPPEWADLGTYFDGDTFTEAAGGIEYALFIIALDRWHMHPAINADTWKRLTIEEADILQGFDDIRSGEAAWTGLTSYKSVMEAYGVEYNPRKCHRLKEWSKTAAASRPASVAEYLTITTGRPWSTASASGYNQGDYAEIVYCEDIYTQQDAEAAGEIALGAASEYSITFPEEDGSEPETVYGYIVADCQAYGPEAVKKLLCKWEGIDPADAVLMIPGNPRTVTTWEYEEVC